MIFAESESLPNIKTKPNPNTYYGITKYFGDEILTAVKSNFASQSIIYEVRGLTVSNEYRSRGVARLLMLGALKFIQIR